MTQLYNIWSKQLSQAWNNQDLSKDPYDYKNIIMTNLQQLGYS